MAAAKTAEASILPHLSSHGEQARRRSLCCRVEKPSAHNRSAQRGTTTTPLPCKTCGPRRRVGSNNHDGALHVTPDFLLLHHLHRFHLVLLPLVGGNKHGRRRRRHRQGRGVRGLLYTMGVTDSCRGRHAAAAKPCNCTYVRHVHFRGIYSTRKSPRQRQASSVC